MENTYIYKGLVQLSCQELFLWIAIDTTIEQISGLDLAGAAAVLSGQPFLPTRGKLGGATKGTSLASLASRKLIRLKMPFAMPMLTGRTLFSMKIAFTRNLGAFVGRAVPGVGWVILGADVVLIAQKARLRYNALVRKEDQL